MTSESNQRIDGTVTSHQSKTCLSKSVQHMKDLIEGTMKTHDDREPTESAFTEHDDRELPEVTFKEHGGRELNEKSLKKNIDRDATDVPHQNNRNDSLSKDVPSINFEGKDQKDNSTILSHAVIVINFLMLVGAIIISHPRIDLGVTAESANYIQIIPVIGLSIYVGLISGYIPSPLYSWNERWPKEYAFVQLVLLIMTASRLTRHEGAADIIEDADDGKEDGYEYNSEELADFTYWLGSNLHTHFFNGNYNHFIETFTEEMVMFLLAVAVSYIVARIDWLRNIDETKKLHIALVFLRNLFIHNLISLCFIWEDLSNPKGSTHQQCMKEHNIKPGLVAPDYPLSDIASEFAAGWKVFHLSDLWLVRLSHAILYPSILLLYTRRSLTVFFIWVCFIEIDVFHMLADMMHYVSGPELAEERLDFQSHSTDCYLNVQFVQNILAYPLNFLYLTTSFGDTAPVNIVKS